MNNFSFPRELLDSHTHVFNIEHNGSICSSAHGFFCGCEYPHTIQLVENVDIKNGDWLIDTVSNQRYLAVDARPIIIDGKPVDWLISYRTDQQQNYSATNINISNVNGPSIIGNQQNATINNTVNNLEDIKSLISSLPSEDIETGEALLNELSEVENSNHPILVEGSLSKFSDLLKKHTDLLTAVGGWAVQLLIGK